MRVFHIERICSMCVNPRSKPIIPKLLFLFQGLLAYFLNELLWGLYLYLYGFRRCEQCFDPSHQEGELYENNDVEYA